MQTIYGTSKLSEEESMTIEDKYFKQIIDATEEAASWSQIDPLANMNDDPVYIFSCFKDPMLDPINTNILRRFYNKYTN